MIICSSIAWLWSRNKCNTREHLSSVMLILSLGDISFCCQWCWEIFAGLILFALVCLIVGSAARPFYPLPSKVADGERQPLQTSRPYNIAHRGSNGELPEETAAAYMVIMQSLTFCIWNVLNIWQRKGWGYGLKWYTLRVWLWIWLVFF